MNGVVVSDDFNMKAISQDPNRWGEAIVEAISACIDLLLVCSGKVHDWNYAINAIEAEAKSSNTFKKTLEEASSRVERFRSLLK